MAFYPHVSSYTYSAVLNLFTYLLLPHMLAFPEQAPFCEISSQAQGRVPVNDYWLNESNETVMFKHGLRINSSPVFAFPLKSIKRKQKSQKMEFFSKEFRFQIISPPEEFLSLNYVNNRLISTSHILHGSLALCFANLLSTKFI